MARTFARCDTPMERCPLICLEGRAAGYAPAARLRRTTDRAVPPEVVA